MGNKRSFGSVLKRFFKDLVTKNIALKIVSLLFAMLLWGYVMMDQAPARVKVVNGISLSFEGEADLITRKLVVRGDRSEILKDVSARISTELTKYADLDASDVTATVSLKNISKPDVYVLQIQAVSNEGNTLSVNPGSVTVEVDNLVSRRVPISVAYDESALPEGYWAEAPVLSRSEVEIEGAAQDVATVVRAECRLDLTGCRESINRSVELVLMDADGQEVSSTLFLGQIPAVTVQMDIYPMLTLPVELSAALRGKDSMPENYEIVSSSISPDAITVAGPVQALEGLTGIQVDEIDLSGRDTSLLTEVMLHVPEGVVVLGEETATVYIEIREKRITVEYPAVPIEVNGLDRRTGAVLSAETANVKLTGPVSVMGKLQRENISLSVDATNLESGTYTLGISAKVGSPEMQKALEIALSLTNVEVVITK